MHEVAISWRAECGKRHDSTAKIRKYSLEKAKSEAKGRAPDSSCSVGTCRMERLVSKGEPRDPGRIRGISSTTIHTFLCFREHIPNDAYGPMDPLVGRLSGLVKRDVLLRPSHFSIRVADVR